MCPGPLHKATSTLPMFLPTSATQFVNAQAHYHRLRPRPLTPPSPPPPAPPAAGRGEDVLGGLSRTPRVRWVGGGRRGRGLARLGLRSRRPATPPPRRG